jgi:hypothetical protein
MKLDLTAIDLDALADLRVFLAVILLTFAFVVVLAIRHELRRVRITHDPFFHPIGDTPTIPMPQHSILTGPAERSPAEAGIGFSILDLNVTTRSARRAAPAGQGSGGDGASSQGAAAAGPCTLAPTSWRGNHAR